MKCLLIGCEREAAKGATCEACRTVLVSYKGPLFARLATIHAALQMESPAMRKAATTSLGKLLEGMRVC